VAITSCRPQSARKRFTLVKIIERPIVSVEQSVNTITADEISKDENKKPETKAVELSDQDTEKSTNKMKDKK